jgi:Nucleotidyltransferase domain
MALHSWRKALQPLSQQRPAEHTGPMAGTTRRCCSQRWQQISCLCATSAHAFHPDQIVRFGSYAYGQPHLDSDVDLLVVMPCEGRPFRQAAHLPWRLPARRVPLSPAPDLTYAVLLARHLSCHCS